MALCRFCNKWMEKGTGKRKKEFCNNTCRSNYWYGKNKKGKIVATPKKEYDADVLPNDFVDEHLQFDKPEVIKDYDYFADRILKGDCEEPDGHQAFIKEVNNSTLSGRIKSELIAASRIKQN